MIQRRGIKIDRRVPGIDTRQGPAPVTKSFSWKVKEARKYLRDMEDSGDGMLIRFARKELEKLLATQGAQGQAN